MAHHNSTPQSVLDAPTITRTWESKRGADDGPVVTVHTDGETGLQTWDPKAPRRYRRQSTILGRRQARRSMERMLVENPSPEHKVNLKSPHWLRVLKFEKARAAAMQAMADRDLDTQARAALEKLRNG
jgi:hypothetical protein